MVEELAWGFEKPVLRCLAARCDLEENPGFRHIDQNAGLTIGSGNHGMGKSLVIQAGPDRHGAHRVDRYPVNACILPDVFKKIEHQPVARCNRFQMGENRV